MILLNNDINNNLDEDVILSKTLDDFKVHRNAVANVIDSKFKDLITNNIERVEQIDSANQMISYNVDVLAECCGRELNEILVEISNLDDNLNDFIKNSLDEALRLDKIEYDKYLDGDRINE